MIERTIFPELVQHLPKKEITLITGPRQAGKTTLLEKLKQHLEAHGERTLLLNLDVEWDRVHFESQLSLIKKIELELGRRSGFVLIDEIQRKENAGLFLKGLYDLKLPYKFIVTGSGSLELKERIHESLIGRKRIFELSTITFEEFVHYKTEYRYQETLPQFFETETENARKLLDEYLNFGGYPRVVLEDVLAEKNHVINEIYQSILQKDIAYLLQVEKTEAFSSLVKTLASQSGKLVNYAAHTSALGISFQTAKKYLWYAQQIFLVDLITPFARNVRKEITQAPVSYFQDLGLRNYALGLFGCLRSPAEMGFVFQNLVYLTLKTCIKPGATALHFWRTKDKAEVDFVIEVGRELIPIEVKFQSLGREEIPRSLRSFIAKYGPNDAYIINLNLLKTVMVEKTAVHFMPYYQLIMQRF